MKEHEFNQRVRRLFKHQRDLLARKNVLLESTNGIYHRYKYPVLTADHIPVEWRYDLDCGDNPHLLERLGINSVFNPGAARIGDKYYLMARVEGLDRKSFFAVAESTSPIDGFRFHDEPVVIPELDDRETNLYDMRLVQHEDGWIYGLFCVESKDPDAPAWDTCAAAAQGGIARTRDLRTWQRLSNLKSSSPQQRNHVLHPEFVNGKYAFYTRPQEGFIDTGTGGGIGWGLAKNIECAELTDEIIIDARIYHTIKEAKNGLGPAPLKTEKGWLHLAHGVRGTAAGLRYVLYLFMTALDDPARIIHAPGGYFMAPDAEERVGDVSNVLFSSAWINDDSGIVYIYYGSSDTRTHVAESTVEKLIDYTCNTPEDASRSSLCVQQRIRLIQKNRRWV